MANELKRYEKYEKYASTIKNFFLVVGLWPGPGSPKFSNYIIVLYSCCVTLIVLGGINFIVHHSKNVGAVTQAMGICLIGITVMMKVIVFALYRDDIKKTHEVLERTFREDFSSSELRGVLLSPLNSFYQPTMLMIKIFMVNSTVLVIGPLIGVVIQLARGVNPIQYRLLFLTKYPWNPKSSIAIYVVHYFCESFGAAAMGVVSASVDAGLGFYIFQIATQFRVLSYRFSTLESSDDYRQLIRECVLRRRIFTKSCKTLERVYGPIVLWFMVSSAIGLCVNIYQMTKMSSTSIVTAVIYIVAKLLQSLFYGWIGTFLTTETESFRDAVYCSGWAGCDEMTLRTSILIMLMWKPLVLTACRFSTISMDMFVAILNTAVSYFFLLQTIEEKK